MKPIDRNIRFTFHSPTLKTPTMSLSVSETMNILCEHFPFLACAFGFVFLLLSNTFYKIQTYDHNLFTSVTPSDFVLFTVREKEKAYNDEQKDPQVIQPYAAYSPAGHAKVKSPKASHKHPLIFSAN